MPERIDGTGTTSTATCALIGGSGSTGSSLLRTILNRHPALFSGEELSFFNKEQLFEDWKRYSRRLIPPKWRRPLVTRGWFAYPYSRLQHPDYGWRMGEIKAYIGDSPSIRSFTNRYFSRPLEVTGSDIWIEKTPSNCYGFHHFLETFPGGRVIHTARRPLDAIASLIRRGMSPYYASSLWLYNTAAALALHDDARYLLVRYEDLVSRPEQTLRRVCNFLGVAFSRALLDSNPSDSDEHVKNPGWKHDRTETISTASIGSFSKLDWNTQQLVRCSLGMVRVSRAHCSLRSLSFATVEGICGVLGYQTPGWSDTVGDIRLRGTLERERRKDMIQRTVRGYPTHARNYPIELRESSSEAFTGLELSPSAASFDSAAR